MKKLTPGLCAAYKADAMRGLHHEDDRYMLALYGPAAPSPPRTRWTLQPQRGAPGCWHPRLHGRAGHDSRSGGGFYGAKRGGAMRSANGETKSCRVLTRGQAGAALV